VMSNTVEPPSPSDHELNLIADANARLIASAPDLLEAAKAAVAVLTQPAHYEADRVAAVTWLSAAIAVATGETP